MSTEERLNRTEQNLIAAARDEAATLPTQHRDLPPSDSIRGYEILREIHRGGQGAVYQAIQKSTHRKVAIKIMREGPFAGTADKIRFEREVRILAQLDHPNIVAIHDSGSAAGNFYFVMDYIAGQPLDLWMASKHHSIEETLRLFADICEAVSAAHLRGVIHRDLKPGNIRINSAGRPYILDFGLAKVSSGLGASQAQAMTISGQFIGSLPWASPEQAAGRPEQIDVRTDVYSLGVVLYQMLTSKFPYEVVGGMRDVIDNILNSEPVKPRIIRRDIDDEVETIVLKCLSKQHERRYQSAGELARDIRHYLSGEPIEAKRDSTFYILKKQVRRYRAAVILASVIMTLITVSSVAGWIAYRNASETIRLQREADNRERLLAIMVDNLDEYDVEDPFKSERPELLELEVNARWADSALQDLPQAEAKLRTTIGLGFLKLGEYAKSGVQLTQALEARRRSALGPDEQFAGSLHNLARALYNESKFKEAEAHYRQAYELRRQVFGTVSPLVVESLNGIAACMLARAEFTQAEEHFREVLELRRQLLGEDDAYTAASMNNLAKCLMEQGSYAEAEGHFREAVQRIEKLGLHEYVARGWLNVASCRLASGDEQEAERLLETAMEIDRQTLADDHPDIAIVYRELARCHSVQGRLKKAQELCKSALKIQEDRLVAPHAELAATKCLLAAILLERGRSPGPVPLRDLDRAEALLQQAQRTRIELFGQEHPQVAKTRYQLARLRHAQGAFREAEKLCRDALKIQQTKLQGTHPDIADTMVLLGKIMIGTDRTSEGEIWLRQALDSRRQLLPANHWRVAETRGLLGDCLTSIGNYDEANSLLVEAYQTITERLGEQHHKTREALERVIRFFESTNQPNKAEAYRKRRISPTFQE